MKRWRSSYALRGSGVTRWLVTRNGWGGFWILSDGCWIAVQSLWRVDADGDIGVPVGVHDGTCLPSCFRKASISAFLGISTA